MSLPVPYGDRSPARTVSTALAEPAPALPAPWPAPRHRTLYAEGRPVDRDDDFNAWYAQDGLSDGPPAAVPAMRSHRTSCAPCGPLPAPPAEVATAPIPPAPAFLLVIGVGMAVTLGSFAALTVAALAAGLTAAVAVTAALVLATFAAGLIVDLRRRTRGAR